ncbi:hypothetical protein JCM39194_14520 [Desulfotomaculum varum]
MRKQFKIYGQRKKHCRQQCCSLNLQEPDEQNNNRYNEQEKKNAANDWQPEVVIAGFCIRHQINPFFLPIYEKGNLVVMIKILSDELNINKLAKINQYKKEKGAHK